jgi:hypothetical protein
LLEDQVEMVEVMLVDLEEKVVREERDQYM